RPVANIPARHPRIKRGLSRLEKPEFCNDIACLKTDGIDLDWWSIPALDRLFGARARPSQRQDRR
ncbi:MAG: hypothetical protein AAGD40_05565, partial [Pseudomonadota bacterium]